MLHTDTPPLWAASSGERRAASAILATVIGILGALALVHWWAQ